MVDVESLKGKKAQLEQAAKKLNEVLVEKNAAVAALEKEKSDILTEALKLQGEYRLLEGLIAEEIEKTETKTAEPAVDEVAEEAAE